MYRALLTRCSRLIVLLTALAASAEADNLDPNTSWAKVFTEHLSLVFGRFEGRFEGPEFRGRKIHVRKIDTGKDHFIPVKDGLGYFEELLPPGSYYMVGLEATYYPPSRPLNPTRYRPVAQRLAVTTHDDRTNLPAFYIPPNRPVYLGTLVVDNQKDGVIYRGHYMRVIDEYGETFGRLEKLYPRFVSSLAGANIEPGRHFLLKPSQPVSPLEIVEMEDPIRRARDYIAEEKYQQAVNWLQTFMPASEAERIQSNLLIGEALLGDRQYVAAIDKLGDVLEVEPENLRALRLLARAHAYNDDLDDARGLYEALVGYLPQDTEAHLQLGYLYALRSEPARSQLEFASAFEQDMDYLLYDVMPFVVAMKAVKEQSVAYMPPYVIKSVQPPKSLESRRESEEERLALVIDHKGKVVAVQVSPGGESMPVMVLSMIRTTFKPAALNGVPVPSLLVMGGGGWGRPTR